MAGTKKRPGTPFGRKLRAARKRAKLTQLALAYKSGITPQTIARIERGETEALLSSIKALARALDIPFGDLVED